jgi:hypothetical protein
MITRGQMVRGRFWPERQNEFVKFCQNVGIAFIRRCENCRHEFSLTDDSVRGRRAWKLVCSPECNQTIQNERRVDSGEHKINGRNRREKKRLVLNEQTIAKLKTLAEIEGSGGILLDGLKEHFGKYAGEMVSMLTRVRVKAVAQTGYRSTAVCWRVEARLQERARVVAAPV